MQRFRGGLVFKAHTLLYHSTLGLRVIKKKVVFDGVRLYISSLNPKPGVWFTDDWLIGDELTCDWLTVDWLVTADGWALGGVAREQKMLKGHLPRVIYHQLY